MNFWRGCWILWLSGILGAVWGDDPVVPRTRLLSGAVFSGELMELQGGKVSLQPSWSRERVQVPVREMYQTLLQPVQAPESPSRYRVTFTNGDVVETNHVVQTNGVFELTSPWGTRERCAPGVLHQIEPRAEAKASPQWHHSMPVRPWWTLYVSSNKGEQPWKMSRTPEGGYVLSTNQQKWGLDLPESAKGFVLELNIEAMGPAFSLIVLPGMYNVNMASNDPFFRVTFLNNQLAIGNRSTFFRTNLPAGLLSFRYLRMEVQSDPRTVKILLDGTQIADFPLPKNIKTFTPSAVLLTSHGEVVVRDLSLLPLDPVDANQDRIWLNDGTWWDGTFRDWTAAGVRITDTEGVDRLISEDSMTALTFAAKNQKQSKRNNRDVQLFFQDTSSRIHLELLSWRAGRLTGRHGNWVGKLNLPVEAVTQIRWNPHTRLDAEPIGLFEGWTEPGALP